MHCAFVPLVLVGSTARRPRSVRLCRRPRRGVTVRAAATAARPVTNAEKNGAQNGTVDKQHVFTLIRRFSEIPEKQRRAVAITVAFGVGAGICACIQPLMFAGTLNALITLNASTGPPVWAPLRKRIAIQASMYALESVMTYYYVRQMTTVLDGLTARLRTNVYRSALSNDLSYFDVDGSSVNRALTADIPELRLLLLANLSGDRGLRCVIQIVLGVVLCLTIDPILACIIFLFLLPLLSVVSGRLGLAKKDADNKYADAENEVRFSTTQALGAIRTLKASGAEPHEIRQVRSRLARALSASDKGGVIRAQSDVSLRVAIYATIVAVYSVGSWMIGTNRLPLARFLQLSNFTWILLFSLIGSVYTYADGQTISGLLERTYAALDRAELAASRNSESVASLPPVSEGVRIEFRDVAFSYPARPDATVISNLSFSIEPGTTVALVGPSGAGKSTIAALLARFYSPTDGAIFLNGVDIRTIDRASYLRELAYVDQDSKLFNASVRDNITYGKAGRVNDKQVEKAARDANAHDFISALGEGYATKITQGSALSGGQKQRIAIARAILRDAPLLVLDEYSSALDAESEVAVQDALRRIAKNRTVLVIAHRLSTIRNADCILVVDGGRVIEQGSYDELMSSGGLFRSLVAANSRVVMNE